MKIVVASFLLVALLTGCEGGDQGPMEDAEAVVDAMEENGIECEDVETTTEFGPESDADVSERAFCLVGEDTVVVSMFENAEERDSWVEAGELSGKVAVGDYWVAGSDSQELVEEIADELDATIPQGSDQEG